MGQSTIPNETRVSGPSWVVRHLMYVIGVFLIVCLFWVRFLSSAAFHPRALDLLVTVTPILLLIFMYWTYMTSEWREAPVLIRLVARGLFMLAIMGSSLVLLTAMLFTFPFSLAGSSVEIRDAEDNAYIGRTTAAIPDGNGMTLYRRYGLFLDPVAISSRFDTLTPDLVLTFFDESGGKERYCMKLFDRRLRPAGTCGESADHRTARF